MNQRQSPARARLVIGCAGRRQSRAAAVFDASGSGSGSGYDDGLLVFSRDRETGLIGPVISAHASESVWYIAAAPDGSVLYSLTEPGDGAPCVVESLAGWALDLIGSAPTGGTGACHADVSVDGWLDVAHYSGATFSSVRIDSGAAVGAARIHPLAGSGPHEKQDGPHAHQVIPLDDGLVLGVDLGTDLIRVLEREPDGSLTERSSFHVHAGAGPRNLVIGDDALFVANELDNTLSRIAFDRATLRFGNEAFVSTFVDPTLTTESSVGSVMISPDSRFVYVINRGRDTVAVFNTDASGLRAISESAIGGVRPHAAAIADGHLYCANTRSSTITVLPVDAATGQVGDVVQTIAAPVPMAVLPL